MGLDISVYRPKKVEEKIENIDPDDFWIIEDNPELIPIFNSLCLEMEMEFYDFEKSMKDMGYALEDFYEAGMEIGPKAIFYFVHSEEGYEVVIVNPPIIKVKKMGFVLEEVGYQRKGANKKFYEDGIWDSPCVTDLNTLNEHWEKYFSHKTPDSPGGWGSGVEFSLEDDEMRSRFKENIIDKFVEGGNLCYLSLIQNKFPKIKKLTQIQDI
jgi:hypothetical protein